MVDQRGTAVRTRPPRLRIEFGEHDLGRIRVAPEPSPAWELVLSLTSLGAPRVPGSPAAEWLHEAEPALRSPATREALPLLTSLVPAVGDFPDFLTPTCGAAPVDDALEAELAAVRQTPRRTLRTDLDAIAGRAPSGWLRALGNREWDALVTLERAMRGYFREVLEPFWPTLRAAVVPRQASGVRDLAGQGAEHALATLGSSVRWRWPHLEVPYPVDRHLKLDGRGLLLVPSFFCQDTPVTYIDPGRVPVLVYPASHGLPPAADLDNEALADVLGSTRAKILLALARPCSTTQLGRRIGMSIASASHHVGLLRNAGLVRTVRRGSAVLHHLTDAGTTLVEANRVEPPRLRGLHGGLSAHG